MSTQAATNETPIIPAAIEAHATVVTKDEGMFQTKAIQRFEGVFMLEAEVAGQPSATRKKVSKKGAVTMTMLPLSAKDGAASLKTLSGGKTGKELEAFRIAELAKFKGNTSALIGRIQASPEWNPKSIQLNATGDRVTFSFEREEPVSNVTMDDAIKLIAKKTNMSIADVQAMIDLNKPKEVAAPAPEATPAATE